MISKLYLVRDDQQWGWVHVTQITISYIFKGSIQVTMPSNDAVWRPEALYTEVTGALTQDWWMISWPIPQIHC